MYSAAKAKLEQEQLGKVPPQMIEKAIGEDLSEKARLITAIVEKLSPIAEAKLKSARETEAVRKAIYTLDSSLTSIMEMVHSLSLKMDQIEAAKSQNADLERSVLNKLMEVL